MLLFCCCLSFSAPIVNSRSLFVTQHSSHSVVFNVSYHFVYTYIHIILRPKKHLDLCVYVHYLRVDCAASTHYRTLSPLRHSDDILRKRKQVKRDEYYLSFGYVRNCSIHRLINSRSRRPFVISCLPTITVNTRFRKKWQITTSRTNVLFFSTGIFQRFNWRKEKKTCAGNFSLHIA